MEAEHRQRQQQFLEKLGTGVAVFCSAPRAIMHNDVDYNFRQESNFYYLTGFNEPDAVAVFAPNHPEHRYILFVQPKDLSQEIWTGARLGVEAAKEQLGADAVYPIGELEQYLPRYLETGETLYYHFGHHEAFNQRILQHYQRLLASLPKRGTGPRTIFFFFKQKTAYEL